MKKLIAAALILLLTFSLTSCWNGRTILGTTKETSTKHVNKEYVRFTCAEDLEKALNKGENVEGAIVDFTLKDYKFSDTGNDNIYKAGDHLNFISDRKLGVEKGQIMTVKIDSFSLIDDTYWVIRFSPPA